MWCNPPATTSSSAEGCSADKTKSGCCGSSMFHQPTSGLVRSIFWVWLVYHCPFSPLVRRYQSSCPSTVRNSTALSCLFQLTLYPVSGFARPARGLYLEKKTCPLTWTGRSSLCLLLIRFVSSKLPTTCIPARLYDCFWRKPDLC